MENIKEIVDKLIGNCEPQGDSSRDRENLENLKVKCDLIYNLIADVQYITRSKDSYEGSIKAMGLFANKCLRNIKEELL
jgi:hypothetical protein